MVWPGKGPFKKPAQQATGCHANQTNITSLASGPGHHVVSHAGWIFREGRARGPGLLRSASRQTQEGCTHTSVFSYFGALRVSIFDKPLSKETLFFNPFFSTFLCPLLRFGRNLLCDLAWLCGDDGTAKVWDLRKFGSPISTLSGLETIYEHCDVLYSPDQRYIVTGVGVAELPCSKCLVLHFLLGDRRG